MAKFNPVSSIGYSGDSGSTSSPTDTSGSDLSKSSPSFGDDVASRAGNNQTADEAVATTHQEPAFSGLGIVDQAAQDLAKTVKK